MYESQMIWRIVEVTMYLLSINKEEVYRYLGMNPQMVDEQTEQDILEVTAILKEKAVPRFCYQIFYLEKESDLVVKGTNLHFSSKDINKLLEESQQCILMAVTLGQEVDQLLRKYQLMNLSKAVIMDVCASSMIEDFCNQVETEIGKTLLDKHIYFTDRFSPGYGDLSIDIQPTFLRVLDAQRKIGLHVTNTGIMIPRKSITAIIGISKKPQKRNHKSCEICSLSKQCPYKKEEFKSCNI